MANAAADTVVSYCVVPNNRRMLSYRHAYHAGNFADVMKHVTLVAILRYLMRKDSPLCYVDTHAGAGLYDLGSDYARKTGESDAGIARLWQHDGAPPAVADYVALVHACNDDAGLIRYPGSPWIAAKLLRAHDRLALCELHSTDFPVLSDLFSRDRRVRCYAEDSYRFAPGLLPPPERRGLIFMDPAYELHDEYDTAVDALCRMHRRFATGTYALWYPVLDEHRGDTLRRRIETARISDVLHLALRVSPARRRGMYGSAMLVVNPPYTLAATMTDCLPWLSQRLATDDGADWAVTQWVPESR